MKVQKIILVSAAFFMVVIASISSAEETNAASGEWKGNVELGIVNTTGNTETETINTKAKAETEREKWRHTLTFDMLTSKDDGTTTADHHVVNGQSDYKFSAHNYFFAMLNYENDAFSGFEYRISEALGYGRRVIDWPTLTLSFEIGPGARQSKPEIGASEDEVTVRGAAKLVWNIAETSAFTEDLTTDVGEDITITKSVTALTAQINGSLATKITYTVKNTSEVPAGVAKTDTETSVTLVYSF